MTPRTKTALNLFWSFFKIGTFTFGGGYAMIRIIQHEIVEKQRWLSNDEFSDLLALAQSSPGPIAINTAVFIGYKVCGKLGVAATLLGTIIPPFTIILIVAMFFSQIKDNQDVERILKGMRPAVVALIAGAIFTMSKGLSKWRILLAICSLAIIWLTGLSPIYLIIAGAVGGWIYGLKKTE
jgi:chromate transporter